MRRFICPFLMMVVCAPFCRGADALQNDDHISMCGDSIAEQAIYTVFIEDYALMCQPAQKLRTCQYGWGGEQASTLNNRMINDVLWFKPNAITVCYGINDAGFKPLDDSTANKFRAAQKGIIAKAKAAGVRMIVIASPGCVDANNFKNSVEQAEMYNKTLAGLRDVARAVAKEENVIFANVYDPMMDAMTKSKAKYGKEYAFCGTDGLHPAANGHLVMAYAFLKALGCDGNIGTITFDMASGKAEATEGHKVLSSNGGVVSIESSRYPFCFTGDPKASTSRSAMDFVPFNDELNRFKLIVKGAKSEKMKITWGTEEKEFTREALEKGINLAAEFADKNPFIEPFTKVEAAAKLQQRFEIGLDSKVMHAMIGVKEMMPDETEAVEHMVATGAKLQKKLNDAAAAAVVPVKHEIKIEAVK